MRLIPRCLAVVAIGALFFGCSEADPTAETTSSASSASGASTSGSGGSGGGEGGGSSSSTGAGASSGWRSALYPDDWTPSFTAQNGLFLHDFSYAGYHRGEAEPGAPAGAAVLDVVTTYAADPTGTADSTPAVQQAITDAEAMGGAVVFFPEGLYRFDEVLTIHASGVVLRGAGPDKSRLFFTRTQGMSDAAHIHFIAKPSSDLEIPLAGDGASRASFVEVADAGDLDVGDDILIGWKITPEFIDEHEMTGTWKAFNDTWQPFFRRTVVSIDRDVTPNKIVIDVPLRYPAKTRDTASVRRIAGLVDECGVESLGVANAAGWDEAWAVTRTHAIELRNVKDCWVRDVATFPSPIAPASGPGAGAHLLSGGILVADAHRVTVEHTHFGFSQNRGGGGNGYVFELQRTGEVLVRDAIGESGRHNFIQNWGFGTTGCVFSRITSKDGVNMLSKGDTLGLAALSEFHHSLATANLVEASTFDDGFSIVNRNGESTGAGHTGTQNALWNLRGQGMLRSLQFGSGYVIGTQGLLVVTESPLPMGAGTAPVDFVEGLEEAEGLTPASLYDDQRARRLGR